MLTSEYICRVSIVSTITLKTNLSHDIIQFSVLYSVFSADLEQGVPHGPRQNERLDRGLGQVFNGIDPVALQVDGESGGQSGGVHGDNEGDEDPPESQDNACGCVPRLLLYP